MRNSPPPWHKRFSAFIPERQVLAGHPWLQPVAGRLLDLRLWRLQHESVARGVAVGTFWAFVIPLGQTFAAAAHCAWWRGNIPAAAVMTMLTNPLTFGFWLWMAYQIGAFLLGYPPGAIDAADVDAATLFAEYGWPTLLGMGIFAVGGAALGYLVVKLIWRLKVWHKRRTRRIIAQTP
ncbi:MAG: DUF2062 domain-containing protein [Rhodoferax sp.]